MQTIPTPVSSARPAPFLVYLPAAVFTALGALVCWLGLFLDRADAGIMLQKGDKAKKGLFTNDPFPRRALLISVNNYLLLNTVHYGTGIGAVDQKYPGSSTGVLRDRLTRPPMFFPFSQVIEVSDGIAPDSKTVKAHSTRKAVLEAIIKDFAATSRKQDRILILFAGHGVYLDEEKKSYLIPMDGSVKIPASLIPLKWVYDELAKCKAQQKVLILDLFRYSPSRGFELPGAGEGAEGTMPEGFDKDLQNPPAGVQVWSSCVKGQNSVELDGGSAFLQALCNSMRGGTGIAHPKDPMPIEKLVAEVNQRLNGLVAPEKKTQTSRLTGKQAEGAVYNRDEPLPPKLELQAPAARGGETAKDAFVDAILKELKLPPTRDMGVRAFTAAELPAFSAQKLAAYKPDGDLLDLRRRYHAGKEAFAKQYPLRAAYFEVVDALEKSGKVMMRETLYSPIDPKRKAAFLLEMVPLAESQFHLEKALEQMKAASEERERETSLRWRANFDYVQARLQARLIYLYEYNYTLGQIRLDNLPELAPGQTGWRVGIAGTRITVTEKKARDLAKSTQKLWERIQETYPDTPWDLLAQRESIKALGLHWRPKSD